MKRRNEHLEIFSGRQHVLHPKTLIEMSTESFDSESVKFHITDLNEQ